MTSAPQAAKLLRSLGDDVAEVLFDGAEAFVLATDVEQLMSAEPQGTVNLLPAFDQYVVGAPRATPAVLDPARRADVYRPQGWLSPVLLVDGVMAGTWSVNGKGGGTEIVVEPFEPLPAAVAQRAESEAERLTALVAARS
jgi:Winged helix DNA-binding domain